MGIVSLAIAKGIDHITESKDFEGIEKLRRAINDLDQIRKAKESK